MDLPRNDTRILSHARKPSVNSSHMVAFFASIQLHVFSLSFHFFRLPSGLASSPVDGILQREKSLARFFSLTRVRRVHGQEFVTRPPTLFNRTASCSGIFMLMKF